MPVQYQIKTAMLCLFAQIMTTPPPHTRCATTIRAWSESRLYIWLNVVPRLVAQTHWAGRDRFQKWSEEYQKTKDKSTI